MLYKDLPDFIEEKLPNGEPYRYSKVMLFKTKGRSPLNKNLVWAEDLDTKFKSMEG